MSKKEFFSPPPFWDRILIPLGICTLSGFIFYNVPCLKQYVGLGITIPFTITKGLLDGWVIYAIDKKVKRNEHIVHSKYAISKIEHVRYVLNNSLYNSKTQSLTIGDLEVILTDVWKCCLDGEKSKYQEFKGIVGDYKTALRKSQHDSTIKPDISRFITDLHRIETHLREIT